MTCFRLITNEIVKIHDVQSKSTPTPYILILNFAQGSFVNGRLTQVQVLYVWQIGNLEKYLATLNLKNQ